MNKYKKSNRSRSRSRSKSPHKRRQREKEKYKNRQRDRQRSPKNRKKHYSSSSSKSREDSDSRSSDHNKNDKQQQNQNNQARYKIEQTKTLKIQNCSNLQAAQRALTDASINAGTSVPDEVQLKQGHIYAKYPSIEVSTTVKQQLKQTILVGGAQHKINFYPFKRIDLNMSYDWYCDKCDYKNFARRNKCYRCDNQKNMNCKFNYSSQSVAPSKASKEDNINNCSLMVRGPIIMDTEQQVLLDLYQAISSVKDIRMIRNKMTGQLKDFAFIEFFTPEDAALALKLTSSSDFRIKGEKVSVMYSRNKSQDDYAKPLPYEKKEHKKDFNKKQKKDQPVQSYYNRQRQLQIEQQKQRPLITIQQLKQKREQQLKKKAANARQLTEQQAKRRQAEQMARKWQKQVKLQNTILYICVVCRRKFKGETDMKLHQTKSDFHKYNKQKYELSL